VCNNFLAGSYILGIRPIVGAGVCFITFLAGSQTQPLQLGDYYSWILETGMLTFNL